MSTRVRVERGGGGGSQDESCGGGGCSEGAKSKLVTGGEGGRGALSVAGSGDVFDPRPSTLTGTKAMQRTRWHATASARL